MLDSRIIPTMGHLKLGKIKPAHIIEALNIIADSERCDGQEGELSDQTVKHHYRCISAILQDAVEWQIIPYNPASRVKAPRVQKKQAECYDEVQTGNLLQVLAGEPLKYRALVMLAITSGLREGEIMGLEWKHIDFKKQTIKVEQSSQYLPGQGIFTKQPKNEGSKRTIAIPSSMVQLLKDYRKEQNEHRMKLGDKWQGSERLFTTWDGKPGYPGWPGWPGHWFRKFLEDNNLPHVTFHSLRHLNATLLIKEGVPIKNISTRLGHTTISTTMDIYGHALKSDDREAADKMERLFGGDKKGSREKGQGRK